MAPQGGGGVVARPRAGRDSQGWAPHTEDRTVWSPGHTLGAGAAVMPRSGGHLIGHPMLPLCPGQGDVLTESSRVERCPRGRVLVTAPAFTATSVL